MRRDGHHVSLSTLTVCAWRLSIDCSRYRKYPLESWKQTLRLLPAEVHNRQTGYTYTCKQEHSGFLQDALTRVFTLRHIAAPLRTFFRLLALYV